MYLVLIFIILSYVGTLLQLIFYPAIIIYLITKKYKLYKKAGEKGWKSLIPIYNKYILVKIANIDKKWFLLFLILPIYSIFYAVIAIVITLYNYDYDSQFFLTPYLKNYSYYFPHLGGTMTIGFILAILIHVAATYKCTHKVIQIAKTK